MARPILALTAAAAALALSLSGAARDHQSHHHKDQAMSDPTPYAFAIHGGAGTITRDKLTADLEADYRAKLGEALAAGQAVLADGGAATDAVIAAIQVMEDSPLFNAGRGAVYTAEGRNALDASIMDGRTLNAGAVADISRVKSPIALAARVMTDSPHVMLAGEGAEQFARDQGQEMVSPLYFYTERRFQQILQVRGEDKEAVLLDHDGDDRPSKYGTVGAVALDKHGNLAAGTSTGGMTNKMYGRIGDSPIIGAGTYANNASCAVSATGHGEYFIRATVARDICALMEYADLSLAEAADRMVMDKLVKMGGDGGIISVDHAGNVALVFNTPGMYRASVREGEDAIIGIYKDDD
ncbi:beta-aspartyl-peptidase [Rhodothalassium salexigens]|uniref:isoaspartyl peptidase/L-asparaginase family protein n=1 Tax=Rhodothalassium salexigens TaxID=1086 RepID=UPI0019135405|nr:isoaspartyl peptidase/L-asparaginase [Rhodothalassium salexigens]MBK5912354.1 beta-aspartyl-peptidase [Rhodothalassium salexigens]MBK5921484.1 beta-aspartyl-peptidase [Rhodothalassium salexigens]